MVLYSRKLLNSMASFSYESTPKTAIMEAWEFEKISSDYCNQTGKLVLFNREEFMKNAEVFLHNL